MRTTFVRMLVPVFVVCVLFFALEFWFEVDRLGPLTDAQMQWAGTDNRKIVDFLSPMARAYNNVLAMLVATIGLAIPLTANMHTPKLIEMFLKDRLNQAVLLLMAFGAANVLWVAYMVGPGFAPTWAVRLAVGGALAGWIMVIPYFFYVVRFLDPSNILARLRDETTAVVERARAGAIDAETAQDVVHERLFQIGTIVLKSLDRADRGVALEGVWLLKRILDHYGERKGGMADAWFKVDRKDFVGLSAEALEIVNEDRVWFEQKALTQIFLAYQHALSKAPDAVSSMSDTNRVVAVQAARRGDGKALGLSIKYFNNFLREAIKKKDTHAIYDVFEQYRLLAGDLRDRPEVLREIGRYFRVYAEMARAAGLPFVAQLAVFDLGSIVCRAYEAESPAAADLLGEALAMHPSDKGDLPPLVVKAEILLGAFFVEKGLGDPAGKVRASLARVPAATLASAEKDLLAAERSFYEVTDRQVNLEWVPSERRDHVTAFVKSIAPAAA